MLLRMYLRGPGVECERLCKKDPKLSDAAELCDDAVQVSG